MENVKLKFVRLLISILVFALSSCLKRTGDISSQIEISLKDSVYTLRPQSFEINQKRDTIIVGKRGTVIHIPKGIFRLENQEMNASQVIIDLTGCYTLREILESGIETKCNDSLLISFGFINIQANNINGEKLHIRDGAYLTIQLDSNYIDKPLSPDVFYGELSEDMASVNWREDTTFKLETLRRVIEKDTLLDNLRAIELTVFLTNYSIRAPKLGWINLDVYDEKVKAEPLVVTIKDFDISGEPIMVVLKNQRSFVQETIKEGIVRIKNLPSDAEVILMKYGVKDSKPYFGSTEVKVGTVDSVELPIEYCSIEEINRQLEKLEY